jgi:hypothetical protein
LLSRSADLQVGTCRAEARRYNENKILLLGRITVYAFSETSLGKSGPLRGSMPRGLKAHRRRC